MSILANVKAKRPYFHIKKLVDGGAVLDEVDSKSGNSALHFAVLNRSFDTIDVLLNAGANPSATNNIGVTPLHCAFLNGSPLYPIVFLLLKHHANPSLTTQDGKSVFDFDSFGYIARANKEIEDEKNKSAGGGGSSSDMVKVKRTTSRDIEPISGIAIPSQTSAIAPSSVSASSLDKKAQKKMQKDKHKRGKSLSQSPEEEGLSPIARASDNAGPTIIASPVSLGSGSNSIRKVTKDEKKRMTLLTKYIKEGNLVGSKELTTGDKAVNIKELATKDGNTVLHLCAMHGHTLLAMLFLNSHLDVNLLNNKQQTALHIAVQQSNEELVGVLLDYNARDDIPDAQGNTAMVLDVQKMIPLAKAKKMANEGKREQDAERRKREIEQAEADKIRLEEERQRAAVDADADDVLRELEREKVEAQRRREELQRQREEQEKKKLEDRKAERDRIQREQQEKAEEKKKKNFHLEQLERAEERRKKVDELHPKVLVPTPGGGGGGGSGTPSSSSSSSISSPARSPSPSQQPGGLSSTIGGDSDGVSRKRSSSRFDHRKASQAAAAMSLDQLKQSLKLLSPRRENTLSEISKVKTKLDTYEKQGNPQADVDRLFQPNSAESALIKSERQKFVDLRIQKENGLKVQLEKLEATLKSLQQQVVNLQADISNVRDERIEILKSQQQKLAENGVNVALKSLLDFNALISTELDDLTLDEDDIRLDEEIQSQMESSRVTAAAENAPIIEKLSAELRTLENNLSMQENLQKTMTDELVKRQNTF